MAAHSEASAAAEAAAADAAEDAETLAMEPWGTVCCPTPAAHRGLSFEPPDSPPKPPPRRSVAALPRDKWGTATARQVYDAVVARTHEQCAAQRGAAQGSAEWLAAREGSITASQFGAAVGISPYGGPDSVIEDKLWNTFSGSGATRWGSAHEAYACEAFEGWFVRHLVARRVAAGQGREEAQARVAATTRFWHDNLIRFSRTPWMAVSPDGFVDYLDPEGDVAAGSGDATAKGDGRWRTDAPAAEDGRWRTDLMEFKCPFGKRWRRSTEHPYASAPSACFPANVPPHYGAQMLGIMGYLNSHAGEPGALPRAVTRTWFVAWTPARFWVTLYPYVAEDYEEWLFPELKQFFFKRLLPAMVFKANGALGFNAAAGTGDIAPAPDWTRHFFAPR